MKLYRKYFKKILDYFISLVVVILLAPLLTIIIILLFLFNEGKVFFIQKRPGKNEKIFNLYKFKTMNDDRDKNGNLLPDEQRITKIGNFIRKFSLDELLQFINVLKGDMSIIGPRPLLIEYLPLYNEEQKKRHNVKPGITGWAQVNGRNALSWKEKFELDVWYVENISFWLDLKILFRTIIKVFKRDGISSEGMATAPKFNGKN